MAAPQGEIRSYVQDASNTIVAQKDQLQKVNLDLQSCGNPTSIEICSFRYQNSEWETQRLIVARLGDILAHLHVAGGKLSSALQLARRQPGATGFAAILRNIANIPKDEASDSIINLSLNDPASTLTEAMVRVVVANNALSLVREHYLPGVIEKLNAVGLIDQHQNQAEAVTHLGRAVQLIERANTDLGVALAFLNN